MSFRLIGLSSHSCYYLLITLICYILLSSHFHYFSCVYHYLLHSQVIESHISFSESISQEIQQLGTKLLSHLLSQEHFQQDITTKNTVVPLVQLTGIGILYLIDSSQGIREHLYKLAKGSCRYSIVVTSIAADYGV